MFFELFWVLLNLLFCLLLFSCLHELPSEREARERRSSPPAQPAPPRHPAGSLI